MTDIINSDTNGTTPVDVKTEKKVPSTFTGKSFADVEHIVNADGNYLFCRSWKPDQDITALLFICHGYAEHCARYKELAEVLKDLGVYSFSHDHVGHGESEGERVYFSDYKTLIRDVWQHIEMMKAKYPNVPVFLYGHSMGGGISVHAAQERPDFFSGVILSAPLVVVSADTATPVRVFLVKAVNYIAPKIRVAKLNDQWLSQDQDQIEAYNKDPLIDHGGVRVRVGRQLMLMCEDLSNVMSKIEWPFFVAHGEEDKICDIGGSKLIYELANSKDKTLKIYPEAKHMLEHETPDLIKTFFTDIVVWIKEHIPASNQVQEN